MEKNLFAVLLLIVAALTFAACGGSADTETEDTATAEVTYESILNEYAEKMAEATPDLVEAFNTEAADKTGDLTALAELSNAKISELAEICNEGVEKMAELKLKNGDDEATYTDWAGKLQSKYEKQAQYITDAYMSTAAGQ